LPSFFRGLFRGLNDLMERICPPFCVGGVQFDVYCFLIEPIIAPWFSVQDTGVSDPGVIVVFRHNGLLRFVLSDTVVVFYLVLDVAKRASSPVCTLPRIITCKCLKIFFDYLNQKSEYKVFYKLMCWLGVLTCRLTSVMTSPPARRSLWPYYRSAGHRHFSLLMTLSRGRGWSHGLECDSKFVWCLILRSWMTSFTVWIPRPLWTLSLVTYRGTSTIALNVFDWHLCMTAILDLQAQPHNSMPYVHICAIMDLYSRSLLSTDTWDFLPSNQKSSLCRISIFFRFLMIWSFQFNLLSKCNPRYLKI
jgi:hypothetical protein